MSLKTYNQKRSFLKSKEPRGTRERRSKTAPLHFVVQKHDARRLHYDFRLEIDGVLKSWAVPKGPSLNPKDKRLALMTEDHPISYADFEGEIPKGEYGGGDVIVWDRGVYTSDKTTDVSATEKQMRSGLHKGELGFVLLGEKLKGAFALVKMSDRGDNAWLLIKKEDEYAKETDITEKTDSVISGDPLPRDRTNRRKSRSAPPKKQRDSQRKKSDPMPHQIKPMLAKLVDSPFDRIEWYFEPKWDGYRAIAEIQNGRVRLYSRNNVSFSEKYPPIRDALKSIHVDCILDGEIVGLVNGRPDFHALQQYGEREVPLLYTVFDLLYCDGEDLRNKPLRERKRILAAILPKHDRLLFSAHIEKSGKQFFAEMLKEQFEGMIAKDAASPYREGVRTDEWLKVKNYSEQEAIIIGYTKPRGSRKLLGALVLAAYTNGTLTYIGHSGGGFTDTELEDLYGKLSKIKTKRSPFNEKIPINSPITWVEPRYVAQIRFSEWTRSGRMRHPIYKGMREDKKPREVVKEEPVSVQRGVETSKYETATVTITNREKVFWPQEGYTKGDVVDYYDTIADIILPYLHGRPQNLNRHPNGITGKNFFQKNMTSELPPFVDTKEIWSESNNGYIRYVLCNNKETLLYMANLGCIELNPWNSRVSNLNHPDYLILDLDPNGRPFDDLVLVAKEVKAVLDRACKEHYPKTSGKTGMHIIVPVGGRYDYDAIRTFAELLMRLTHERIPDITSLERSPKKRKGKIYLDYLQNRFGQTIAAPYSLRPYPGATVSTPLSWSEVRKGLDPSRFNLKTIHKRIAAKGDLWEQTQHSVVDLSDAIRCLEEFKEI